MNPDAAETYRTNLNGDCIVDKLSVGYDYLPAEIIIGGPPCQPFSVVGNQNGIHDSRNGFPIFIDTVRRLRPRVFLFENVRGLLYSNKWYFDLIVKELEDLDYTVEPFLMNAVHFGVPQNLERLFVVGHNQAFAPPAKAEIPHPPGR